MKYGISTILFDYGNTLVLDPFSSILKLKARSATMALAKVKRITEHQLIRAWTEANNETNYAHISHFYQENTIVEATIRKLGIIPNKTIVNKLLRIYRDGFIEVLKSSQHYEHVKQALLNLKLTGLQLGVLSNERKDYLKIGLKSAGLYNIFDFVLSSEEIGFEKPDVRFFQVALSKLDLVPQKTLYVGDEPVKDIIPAMKVGMKTALFVCPISESTPWRDYREQKSIKICLEIHNISELLNLVL
ncbi:MAG: HAD family hydrolase [Candidatus Bathyarchaeia archaeon]